MIPQINEFVKFDLQYNSISAIVDIFCKLRYDVSQLGATYMCPPEKHRFLFAIGHNLVQANEEWEDWNNEICPTEVHISPLLGILGNILWNQDTHTGKSLLSLS